MAPLGLAIDAIDAVIFDAGGVLLLPDAGLGQALLAELGCDLGRPAWPDVWCRAYYAAMSFLDQTETTGQLSGRRAMAEAVGVAPDRIEAAVSVIGQVAAAPWTAADGAVEALRDLSDAGYRLAVVSDSNGTIAQELERLRICSVRDGEVTRVGAVVDSHLVGVEKPDPAIFRMALDALGVEADRSLYVGDTIRFDVVGARAAGLNPVHVDPFSFCTSLGSQGHGHIASLAELTGWLLP